MPCLKYSSTGSSGAGMGGGPSAGGSGGAAGSGGSTGGKHGGCGCRVGAEEEGAPWVGAALLVGAVLALRRRSLAR